MVTPEPTLPVQPVGEPRPVPPVQPAAPDAAQPVAPGSEPLVPTVPPTRDGAGQPDAVVDPNAPKTGQPENGTPDPTNPEAGNSPKNPNTDPSQASASPTTGQLEAATAQVGTGEPPKSAQPVLEALANGGNFAELLSAEKMGTVDKLYTALEQDGMQKDPKYQEMLEDVKTRPEYQTAVDEIKKQHPDENSEEYKQEMQKFDKAIAVAAAAEFLGTQEGAQYAGEQNPFAKAVKELREVSPVAQDPVVQEKTKALAAEAKKDPNSPETRKAIKDLIKAYQESRAAKFLPSTKKELIFFLIELFAALALPTIPIAVAGLVFSKVSDEVVGKMQANRAAKLNKDRPSASVGAPTGNLKEGEQVHTEAAPTGTNATAPAGGEQTGQTPPAVPETPSAQKAPEPPAQTAPVKPVITPPPSPTGGTPQAA